MWLHHWCSFYQVRLDLQRNESEKVSWFEFQKEVETGCLEHSVTGGLIVSCDWRKGQQSVCHWWKKATDRQALRSANHLVSNKPQKPHRNTPTRNTQDCMPTHTFSIHMRHPWIMFFLWANWAFCHWNDWYILREQKRHTSTYMPEGSVFFRRWEEAAI